MELGYRLARFEGLNNEPDMEAPFAYYYAGRPDRAIAVVSQIVRYQFGLGRGGLPGNDDSGGLSSWYVWASVGLFPVAGQSIYLIGLPQFSEARLQIGDRTMEIIRRNMDEKAQFIRCVKLNGQRLMRSYLSATELLSGGRLEIDNCAALEPEAERWGATHRPPSVDSAAL